MEKWRKIKIKTKTFNPGWHAGTKPFPKNKIIFDITEFNDVISDIEENSFVLNILDKGGYWGSANTGTLTYFSIEYYDDYKSGIPIITAISEDPPIKTIDNNEIVAEVRIPSSDVSLYTGKTTYFIGDEVAFTCKNNGDKQIYFPRLSPWQIEKKVNDGWTPVYAPLSLQMIDELESGGGKEWSWNQKDNIGSQLYSGDYRISLSYSADNSWTSIFTKYAYFSIAGYSFDPLVISTDKSTYNSHENVSITAKNIVDEALYLKKWYVEKKTIDGTWESIYESNRFSNYIFATINNTLVTIPYNFTDTILDNYTWGSIQLNESVFGNWTIIGGHDESSIVLPNETVGIWTSGGVLVGNWSDISITGSISKGDATGRLGESIIIEGVDLPDILPIDWPYGTPIEDPYVYPVAVLIPNQKLTWSWSQMISDDEKADSGEYRIKVEYNYGYATSEVFSIV